MDFVDVWKNALFTLYG